MAGAGDTARGTGRGPGQRSARSGSGAASTGWAAANRKRRLLASIPTLIVLYAVYLNTVGAAPSRAGGCFAAACVALLIGLLLRPLFVLLVMLCLGARPTHLRIGAGPLLGFRVGHRCTFAFHAVPISFGAAYLPRRPHYGRDLRLMFGAIVLGPLVLNALGSLLLPSYVRPLCLVFGLTYTVLDAVTQQPDFPRTMGARAFLETSKDLDPMAADPFWGAVAHGIDAARFGDIEGAAVQIEYLKERGHAGADSIEAVIHRVRGNYAALVRLHAAALHKPRPANPAPVTPHKRALNGFLRASLLAALAVNILLLLERDPSRREQALPNVDRMLGQLAGPSSARGAAHAYALRALLDAHPYESLELTKRQLAKANNPIDFADALCTRARAYALQGRTEAAHAALRRAERIAPWYARVGIVQLLLGLEPTALADMAALDMAAEAEVFDDPWAAPAARSTM